MRRFDSWIHTYTRKWNPGKVSDIKGQFHEIYDLIFFIKFLPGKSFWGLFSNFKPRKIPDTDIVIPQKIIIFNTKTRLYLNKFSQTKVFWSTPGWSKPKESIGIQILKNEVRMKKPWARKSCETVALTVICTVQIIKVRVYI